MANKALALTGKILLHPVTIFLSIAAGAYIGLEHRELAAKMAKPGAIYLGLLQMCVLPLMISAVILGVGKLLRLKQTHTFIIRLVLTFVAGMILAGCVGMLFGQFGKPGLGLAKEQKALLGREIVKMEQADDLAHSSKEKKTLMDFIADMIPTNVFHAISEGQSLPVLFFCLILGIALGQLKSKSVDTALSIADATYESLLNVIQWLMYGLPVGLLCLFADQMSQIGLGVLGALMKLIIFMFIGSLFLMVVYFIIIWLRSGLPVLTVFKALKRTTIISLGTSSSFAALPFALEDLHKQLGFEKESTDLVIPLGITLNPHGNILCFALMAMFLGQVYDAPFAASDLTVLVMASVLAGVAASSAPGVASLSMFALVLEPFGLPALVGIILLTAINPIIDPILTAVNMLGNCASLSLITNDTPQPEKEAEGDSPPGSDSNA